MEIDRGGVEKGDRRDATTEVPNQPFAEHGRNSQALGHRELTVIQVSFFT